MNNDKTAPPFLGIRAFLLLANLAATVVAWMGYIHLGFFMALASMMFMNVVLTAIWEEL